MLAYIGDFNRAVHDLEVITESLSESLNTQTLDLLPSLQGVSSRHSIVTLTAVLKRSRQLHDSIRGAAKKIQDIELTLGTRVKSLHNALSPINILVPDVLALIFEFVIGEEGYGEFPLSTPLILAQVCSKWRKVVFSHAFLWSGEVAVSERALGMALRHVSLCRNNHLDDLFYESKPNIPSWIRDGILQSHLRKLTLSGSGPLEEALLFGGTFSQLHTLRLVNDHSPSKLVFSRSRFALPSTRHYRLDCLDAPQIEILDLTRIAIASFGSIGPRLTDLHVNKGAWSPDTWSTLFVECPNIEVARFTGVEMEAAPVQLRRMPGPLLSLRILQLDWCDAVTVAYALDMASAPNLQCLIICGGERGGYYGEDPSVWRGIGEAAMQRATETRTRWSQEYLLRDSLWRQIGPKFTTFLSRSSRITTMILAGHIDVVDNFLECLITMPGDGHFSHLMVSCFGQTAKQVNHSMFYVKRFIYHRRLALGLNPINLCLSGCGQPDRVYFSAMCDTVHLGRCGCDRDLDEDEREDYEVYKQQPQVVYDSPELRVSLNEIKHMMHISSAPT